MIKKFASIDGFFNNKIKYENFNKDKKLKFKKYTILGSGNSISNIPFDKKSILLKDILKKKIIINKKNFELTVSGNTEVFELHNFLIKHSLYISSFPSYPSVNLGACVANCVHGLQPKKGCIDRYIKKIKIYNPNFGYKILTRNKNSNLFHLTIGGMGLTGVIVEVTIKAQPLKSTFIKKKTFKVDSLLEGYYFLKNSKSFYNQNNFFITNSNKNFSQGIISTGDFVGKNKIKKIMTKKKITNIRLGILNYKIIRFFLKKIFIFFKINLDKNLIHINEALFPSNSKLLYFNLLTPKFIEHQIIIPDKNVKNYLDQFEEIVVKFQPSITLCHLKIFSGVSKFLQFNDKGLSIAIHILVNKKFNIFYKELQKIDLHNNCKVNLYKNSMINIKSVKKNYVKNFFDFKKKIKKLNKNIFFTNNIFTEKFYNDK